MVYESILLDQLTTNLGVRGSNPLERATFNVSLILKNKDLIKKLILIDFNFKSGGTYGGT